jgi:APA family basic amino acid/polyamine antiporter
VVVALVAGFTPIGKLSELTSIGTLLAFVLVCLGVIILRRTSPDTPRPFRTPWMPWIPIIGIATCVVQMVSLPWATWERLSIWLVLGFVVYFGYSRKRAAGARRQRAATAPLMPVGSQPFAP